MAMTIGKYKRSANLLLIALLVALLLVLCSALTVHAATVSLDDQANVLDTTSVQTEAAKLPVSVLIYTTRAFTGEQDALNKSTRLRLPDQRTIAIGIDVTHRHLSIQGGTEVKLSDSQANDAINAFRDNYNNGDYTGATVASINSLNSSLTRADVDSWPGIVVTLLFLGIAGVIIFFVLRNRRNRNIPPYNGGRQNGDYNAPYYTSNHTSGVVYPGYHGSAGFGGGAGGGFGGGGGGGGGGSF